MKNLKFKSALLIFYVLAVFSLTKCSTQQQTKKPHTVSTFHSISIYWSPEDGAIDKNILVKFRKKGSDIWREALPLKYNVVTDSIKVADVMLAPDQHESYRGSIVNLTPNTEYEIALTLEGTKYAQNIFAKTWSEDFPVGETIKTESGNQTIVVSQTGSPDGYILIDGTGVTIDVENKQNNCIKITGSYVIVRGFNLAGASEHGIFLNSDCHDVIIEKCDISNWGGVDESGNGFGTYHGAIYSHDIYTDYPISANPMKRIIIQRNKIHNPRYNSNSWAEWNTENKSYHPYGPQAIMLFEPEGNIVIRYNEIWSDKDHYYNDILGWGLNGSFKGFPGPDSDIYGNYLANCWDDAIEAEGGGKNIRIWNNYMENIFVPIATVKNTIGPIYIWNNVSGKSYSKPGSKYGEYGLGYKSTEHSNQNQYLYIFNNTTLQPDGLGAGGLGTVYNLNSTLNKITTRNNIINVHDSTEYSIGTNYNCTVDINYDLCNKKYPKELETQGVQGVPIYSADFGFDVKTMTGNFQLSENSPGYLAGIVVPNFCEIFRGKAPDMGAHQKGSKNIVYGVKSNYTPE